MSLPFPSVPDLDPLDMLDEPGWAAALRRNSYVPRLDRKGWVLACDILSLGETDYRKGMLQAYNLLYDAHLDLSDPDATEALADVKADKEHYERYYLNAQGKDTDLEMYHRMTVVCQQLRQSHSAELAAAYQERAEHLVREYRYGLDPDGKKWTYRSLAEATGLSAHTNVRDAVKAAGDRVSGYPVVVQAVEADKYLPPRPSSQGRVNPNGVDITNPAIASLGVWQRPEVAEFIAAHQGDGVLIVAWFTPGQLHGNIATMQVELMRHEYLAIREEAHRDWQG